MINESYIPNDSEINDLAELYKVFGDYTRVKILSTLLDEELCVGCITRLTHVSQSAVSHQLRLLKQSGLVKYRREGKQMFYSLDDEYVKSIIKISLEHIKHKRG
ncbi:MAG: helix-turn-helix transcriptional regulator [Eubacteriaceae bacterium]|nr:helix-turn-helix transcriptional regulator [Eubacteriaceae bacterium]